MLLTDGANTAGALKPAQATRLAQASGLRIHTIGLGSKPAKAAPRAQGQEPIDAFERAVQKGTSLALQLNNLSKDLNEEALRGLAAATGGHYFRATGRATLERLYSVLDEIEPVRTDSRAIQPVTALYRWPLVAGLGAVIVVSPTPWITKAHGDLAPGPRACVRDGWLTNIDG